MITAKNDKMFSFRGLSSDTKPTDWNGVQISTGSKFIEIDTSKIYLYDSDSQQWIEFTPAGGGGGGGSSDLPTVTSSDNGKFLEVVGGSWSKSTDKAFTIPLIEIDNSQIIDTSPVTIQLTDDQYNIINTNKFIEIPADLLGYYGTIIFIKYAISDNTKIAFACQSFTFDTASNVITGFGTSLIIIDKSTKIATYSSLLAQSANGEEF